jgi:hypothetical protein
MTRFEQHGARLVSIRGASERTGLKRTHLNALLDRGAITSIKLLDRRLIVTASLEAFIARQRERATRDRRVRVPPQDADRLRP